MDKLFLAEMIGTMILILLGGGVVANVVLKGTKGNDSGWIVITIGWAVAVGVPVFVFAETSGAHFNPAFTIAAAVIGDIAWGQAIQFIIAQLIGAFIGACIVFAMYYDHFKNTEDVGAKLAVFSTGPAIKNYKLNFISEFIGTFVLVFAILGIASSELAPGFMSLSVGMIVLGIGLSLGGTTGYAINPARDLAPRIAHAILPIPNKGDSDWGYAWIPVIAPIMGAIAGALIWVNIFR